MKRIGLICFLFLLLWIPNKVFAINEVNIYFFHSNSCDICNQERVYLDALKKRYPNMRVYSYEISDSSNFELMQKAKSIYQETRSGVPYTVIGDSSYLGFSQNNKALFQRKVYEYSKNAYTNKLGKELGISYRNDLEGEVVEYKNNEDYQIEETSGNTHVTTPIKSQQDKIDRVSIYLIGSGVILSIIAFIIYLFEKRNHL